MTDPKTPTPPDPTGNPYPPGTPGGPPEPPQPAAKIGGEPAYTLSQMKAHGQACYEKGAEDATTIKGGICPVCSHDLNAAHALIEPPQPAEDEEGE